MTRYRIQEGPRKVDDFVGRYACNLNCLRMPQDGIVSSRILQIMITYQLIVDRLPPGIATNRCDRSTSAAQELGL